MIAKDRAWERREFLVKGLALGATLIAGGAGLPCCVRAALAGEAPQETSNGSKQNAPAIIRLLALPKYVT